MARLIDDLIDLARLTRQTMKREPSTSARSSSRSSPSCARKTRPAHRSHVEPNLIAAADRA
jgi:hypothetical protein